MTQKEIDNNMKEAAIQASIILKEATDKCNMERYYLTVNDFEGKKYCIAFFKTDDNHADTTAEIIKVIDRKYPSL